LKKLLLYGPLLGLRKIVLYLLITAIVLGLVLYFVANSPLVIKKLADTYAPDYNITYSRIHGNVRLKRLLLLSQIRIIMKTMKVAVLNLLTLM